jgi:sterol desaturase/sphingolipid hydroxylase (fatty acid hydroxylase superfamily)
MNDWLLHTENLLRLSFFITVFLVMVLWEYLKPRRALTQSKSTRWMNNLSIVLIDVLCLRIVFPVTAVSMAQIVQQYSWGLFNHLEVVFGLKVLISFVLLDLVIYLQHVMFHAVPLFWRFHRMHHVDLDFDVTTGIRFHPIEILFSMLIKFAAIIIIGAPMIAVLIFEITLNATSLFNHSNIKMPLIIDKVLRFMIVTPDMHRVHHSDIPSETNSNYGFNLSVWDRLFATYIDKPQKGHEKMIIGVSSIRAPRICIKLLGMLMLPFHANGDDSDDNKS